MSKLFVDKTIEIKAPALLVWEVLTKPEYTNKWTFRFANNTPFFIESDWQSSSPVLWKDEKGIVLVEGKVTKIELHKFLRFTVSDVKGEKPSLTDEDGITFQLSENGMKTVLHVLQGDFSVVADGQKYYEMTVQSWDRALPKIKELAEENFN